MEYWGLVNRHIVQLPYLRCEHIQCELPAAAIGCFGSAPESPTVIHEADSCGISATAGTVVCQRKILQHNTAAAARRTESTSGVRISQELPWMTEHCWQWNAVQIRTPDAVGTQHFSPGRFGDCGACAKVPCFTDQGILATVKRAAEVLEKAERELSAMMKIAQEELGLELTQDPAEA